MKFVSLHTQLFELEIHEYAALCGHSVISRMSEETRRGLLGYLYLGKKLVPFLSIHEIGGINENAEARAAGEFIRPIDFRIGSGLMGSQRHHGKVAPS